MTEDRITQALRSMEEEVAPAPTEQALAEVRAQSARRSRLRTAVRSAIGVAAASLVIVGGLSLINRDDGQAVISNRPTTTTATTLPPWIVTASTNPDPGPAPETPPRLRDDQLDDVVGVELRTWFFDDQTEGFWSADAAQVEAIVAALGHAGDEPFDRPEYIDHAYVRFELDDGSFGLLEMDVESGWIEPDRRLPDDLTREIREGLNDVVGHPWEEVDLDDPDNHVHRVLEHVSPPWTSPEAARDDLLAAFEQVRYGEYEHWYGEVREGEGVDFIEIRWRGMGDDSGRGWDYRFWLIEASGTWTLDDVVSERGLCLRSPFFWYDDSAEWSCT